MFAFYGGAHKSMRGWHNMYENDVAGIARTLSQAPELGGKNDILCVLLGPFTPLQREYVKSRMMIRIDHVLNALRWLKRNNPLYKDITVPTDNDLPKAFVIDEGIEDESQNTNIESRIEYTVVFPETEKITATNGGYKTQAELKELLFSRLDARTDTSVVSRPTENRLVDYEGDTLLRAFPLQFPYGVGLPPEKGSGRSDSKAAATSKLDYLQHLQHMSIRHFHRSDFILVLHNMYKCQRAVSIAYLRAKRDWEMILLPNTLLIWEWIEYKTPSIKPMLDSMYRTESQENF
jgi:hypothetical protein